MADNEEPAPWLSYTAFWVDQVNPDNPPPLPLEAWRSLARAEKGEQAEERDREERAEERREREVFQATQSGHPGFRDVGEILAANERRLAMAEQAERWREKQGRPSQAIPGSPGRPLISATWSLE